MAGPEVFADGARPAGMDVFADDPLGMANPARFKAKYPRLGKWIRDSVNQHPDVAGLIQFNSLFPWATLGGAAGLGALAASGPDDPNL